MDSHSPTEIAEQAKNAYQDGEFTKAAELFKIAANGFDAQNDSAAVAEMSNNRSVALLQAGDADGALAAALGTDQVFEEIKDSKRQAMALGNQAAALEALDCLEEAEQAYRSSADLFKAAGEDDLYATVMQSISGLQLRSGLQLEALTSMQAGVDNVKKPGLRQRLLKWLLQIPFRFFNR